MTKKNRVNEYKYILIKTVSNSLNPSIKARALLLYIHTLHTVYLHKCCIISYECNRYRCIGYIFLYYVNVASSFPM